MPFFLPSMKYFFVILAKLFPFIFVLFLSGCGKTELYSGLQETQANRMMAILIEDGIPCEKTPGAESTYSLMVDPNQFARAVDILTEYGYPKETYQGVGQAFQKSGLVSSPTEERIRFMYALSQDVAATLALIDGVIDAQVHIVLPNNNPFAQDAYPSSAAVFISYRPDSNVEASIAQIKGLVMNSVEGLTYDKISVALFPVALRQTVMSSSASHDNANLWVEGIAGLLVLLILGVGGFLSWQKWTQKANTPAP